MKHALSQEIYGAYYGGGTKFNITTDTQTPGHLTPARIEGEMAERSLVARLVKGGSRDLEQVKAQVRESYLTLGLANNAEEAETLLQRLADSVVNRSKSNGHRTPVDLGEWVKKHEKNGACSEVSGAVKG